MGGADHRHRVGQRAFYQSRGSEGAIVESCLVRHPLTKKSGIDRDAGSAGAGEHYGK
ncbi:hypothetical protein CUJ84_pRLN5000269 (plasmid) [Rhizobium leguminosarum]|uniref:Uncharacterized protein n=1 Tax=Rhizobium leguminosarum TaxID=384 RepID=A0A2K9ZJD2_RHILE|nr:hypothetical protein CUJ84_pRLN5000269 [Rhizobium leguminosarum]